MDERRGQPRLTLEQIDAALLAAVPAGHGLTVLPFLTGERSTGGSPARGAVCGLEWDTKGLDILQAGMEAVAYRFAAILAALRPAAPAARELVGTGGALSRLLPGDRSSRTSWKFPSAVPASPRHQAEGGAARAGIARPCRRCRIRAAADRTDLLPAGRCGCRAPLRVQAQERLRVACQSTKTGFTAGSVPSTIPASTSSRRCRRPAGPHLHDPCPGPGFPAPADRLRRPAASCRSVLAGHPAPYSAPSAPDRVVRVSDRRIEVREHLLKSYNDLFHEGAAIGAARRARSCRNHRASAPAEPSRIVVVADPLRFVDRPGNPVPPYPSLLLNKVLRGDRHGLPLADEDTLAVQRFLHRDPELPWLALHAGCRGSNRTLYMK